MQKIRFSLMLKLVIPIFRYRVLPVFDTCKSALLISVDKNQITKKREIFLDDLTLNERVEFLQRAGITIIICGGISDVFLNMFSHAGIKIISGIVGAVNEVIDAFIDGRLDDPVFHMPGYTLNSSTQNREAETDAP